MATVKCPNCGQAALARKIVPLYEARLGGLPVRVENAEFAECSACGETVVRAQEMKRWQQAQQEQLRAGGHIPSPDEVKRVREHFGLSVSDFAGLLGVTRQTVHAWERPGLDALPLGPAALLIGLLREESRGQVQGVLAWLQKQARGRGLEMRTQAKGGEEPPVRLPNYPQAGARRRARA